jgi:hypothetical protein
VFAVEMVKSLKIKLGTTYFTSNSTYVTPARMRHEKRHKRQWMRY